MFVYFVATVQQSDWHYGKASCATTSRTLADTLLAASNHEKLAEKSATKDDNADKGKNGGKQDRGNRTPAAHKTISLLFWPKI